MSLASAMRGWGDALRQGGSAFGRRPLRTGLGVVAIAVAVATLVLIDAAIVGLSAFARQSAARAFGSETFVLAQVAAPGQISRRELEQKLERNQPLRRADVRFLEGNAEERAIYAAMAQRIAEVSAGASKVENAAVVGTGARMAEIRDLAIAGGRFFSLDEERRGAQVAVLGREVADELFAVRDPLGQTVRLRGRGFTVIGVQARLGTTGGQSLDRYVWVPLPAFERLFGARDSLQVSVRAPLGAAVEVAEDRARASMRARRQLAPGESDSFDLLPPTAARDFVLALARRIGMAAPLLSVMALLAAIVVVTNTTLVSVTQRTFEIGVRRAVGATRGAIVREVLAEAAIVATVGGIVGTVLVAGLVRLLAPKLGLDLAVGGHTVVVALAHAAGAGLLAGLYPAVRAARLPVVRALRVE